jgi:hypothetical protein
MTIRPRTSFTFLTLVAALLVTPAVRAKRNPPVEVPPVVDGDIRYEAPHFSNPCNQNGGCVVAYDNATNAGLWFVQVYCTHYDADLERDVQDVFITELSVDSGKLLVANEKGKHFAIDLASRDVTGDSTGCSNSSWIECAFAATRHSPKRPGVLMLLGVGLAIVLARTRFRRT